MSKIDFYPDIYEYLEGADNSKNVKVNNLEDIYLKIRAHTALSREASRELLKWFFQEIRSAMLRGDEVYLRKFGKFRLSSPVTTKNKRKVFLEFKPYENLVNKINKNDN